MNLIAERFVSLRIHIESWDKSLLFIKIYIFLLAHISIDCTFSSLDEARTIRKSAQSELIRETSQQISTFNNNPE